MLRVNFNEKNVRKVLVNRFDKEFIVIALCDDECTVKIRAPECQLSQRPKIKAGW